MTVQWPDRTMADEGGGGGDSSTAVKKPEKAGRDTSRMVAAKPLREPRERSTTGKKKLAERKDGIFCRYCVSAGRHIFVLLLRFHFSSSFVPLRSFISPSRDFQFQFLSPRFSGFPEGILAEGCQENENADIGGDDWGRRPVSSLEKSRWLTSALTTR